MNTVMPWLLGLVALALTAVAALVYGLSLDPVRSGTATKACRAPATKVLETILDVETQPRWRKSVRSVERNSDASGWIETTTHNERIAFNLQEANEQRIALSFSSNRGYHGRWLSALNETGSNRTVIVATEEATVPNPFGRVLARLFFNPGAFASEYLDALCAEAERRAGLGR